VSHRRGAGDAGSLERYPSLFWGVSTTATSRAQFPLHPYLFCKLDAVIAENMPLNNFILIINKNKEL